MTTTYRVGIEIELSEENFTVDVKSGKERKAEEIVKELAAEKYGLSDLVARGANLDYRFNVTELQTELKSAGAPRRRWGRLEVRMQLSH